jgi:hypothetical protein
MSVIPAYYRRERLGELRFEGSQDKKLVGPPSQQKSQVLWYRPMNPSFVGSIGRKITVLGLPRLKYNHLKNNLNCKGLK